MKSLFVMYIGGKHENAMIEVHDMRFIVAKTLEDTYHELRKNWWGKPKNLHLDAWGVLRWVDGYEVLIKDVCPANQENRLFFVNLGGYDKKQFTELHKNIFVVAKNESKAKIKALKQILSWESYHKDCQFEIDQLLSLNEIAENQNHFIHLEPNPKEISFDFTVGYVSIGKSTD